jgi:REP element-mobilizing transposase RayT
MRRLSPACYQGRAFVHWSMALQDRKTGWLTPSLHNRFREIQLHALSRYQLLCLCYCLMPDHLHLLWAGLSDDSDQDKAGVFFRKYFNRLLAEEAGAGSGSAPALTGAARLPAPEARTGAARLPAPEARTGAARLPAPEARTGAARLPAPGTRPGAPSLQKQAWDVVLRERDRERGALERLLFYITENPVRESLVPDARLWPYAGSQASGYPELDWRDKDFTDRLWKIYESEVRRFGAARLPAPGTAPEPEAAPLPPRETRAHRDGAERLPVPAAGAERLPVPGASSRAGNGSAPSRRGPHA